MLLAVPGRLLLASVTVCAIHSLPMLRIAETQVAVTAPGAWSLLQVPIPH